MNLPASAVVRVSPLPLGFLGLFIATTVYAVIQVGWLSKSSGATAGVAVLSVTVGAQLLACTIAFASGDTTAGTAMGLLAGTWAAVAATTVLSGSLAPSNPLGVVLLCSGTAMLVPALAGSAPPIAAIVMITTSLRFVVTGIAELSGTQVWTVAAGIIGLLLAAVSFYAAVALEAASTGQRQFPLAGARNSSP